MELSHVYTWLAACRLGLLSAKLRCPALWCKSVALHGDRSTPSSRPSSFNGIAAVRCTLVPTTPQHLAAATLTGTIQLSEIEVISLFVKGNSIKGCHLQPCMHCLVRCAAVHSHSQPVCSHLVFHPSHTLASTIQSFDGCCTMCCISVGL